MLVWLKIAAIYLAACALLALFIGPMIAYGNKTSDTEHSTTYQRKRRRRRQRRSRVSQPLSVQQPLRVGIIHPPPYGTACCLL